MRKNFNTAPLPFQGQKRNFVKEFKKALKNYPKDAVYVDLFGGSGLLSHTVKATYPNAKVVYNDYDDFSKRLANIDQTNTLLAKLRATLPIELKGTKVSEVLKNKILKIVKEHENMHGYVDYITLSSSLLFSSKYVTNFEDLEKSTFYNKVIKSSYNADGYLEGLKVVSKDYMDLFKKYSQFKNVVFLIDPPYLSTDTSTYNSDKYWKLKNYLDVLLLLKDTNYFYFTSNKSSIVELCEWMETNTAVANPFGGAKVVYHYNSTSHNTGYTDIMLYRTNTTF